MTEAQYQRKLIKKLRVMFPGCHIMKNDPMQTQGIPDLLILYNNCWGMLEVKLDDAPKQSNQDYYVERFSLMSFASFISPETEEDVLHDLQHAFGLIGETRVS